MSREPASASNGLVDADERFVAVYAKKSHGVYDGLSYAAERGGYQLRVAKTFSSCHPTTSPAAREAGTSMMR